MYEYKLETHLNTLCSQHPRYTNLYSTWTLNKRACSDLLKNVVIHYPHFSMHDASHAETVISNIEMLLGDRIQKLSPTDTWLLLHAGYAHDLGMVVQWSEIESVWKQLDFQQYLSTLLSSSDPDLRDAAAFIQNIKDFSSDQIWPLKAQRYVSLINAAYFRKQHARLSKTYLSSSRPEFGLDLGHNNLIQPRLIKLLSQICALHTEPLSNVLNLDYQTNGFDSDYAHPRFIAMLLRLGDLLDIDNGRFNTGAELSFGGLPATSLPHKKKHNATAQLLITPAEIRFRSDCPDSETYLEARQFVTWLENEVDFLTKYWAKIIPDDLGGYAPSFDCKELLIRGIPDIDDVAGLKFEISQDKAFQIIEGSNIYENPFVFIREIIQNAADASKLQLWHDLISGTYRAWCPLPEDSILQPYDLDNKIYSSYPINVRLSTSSDGLVQVEVTDRGTGISIDSFKRMCHVGTSTSGSKQLQETIQEMPSWLRPTAGFGIGLQSIFLLTDQFEINTSTGIDSFHAVIHSNRTGGYLQLQRSEHSFPRGTTIRLQFKLPDNIRYSWGGETDYYLESHFDPMDPINRIGEVHVMETIHINCSNSIFPIRVTCEEASVQPLEIGNYLPAVGNEWETWQGRYRYLLTESADCLQLWDMQTATYANFKFSAISHTNTELRFKGMKVKKSIHNVGIDGISVFLDFYGLDTKNTITLDRSAWTREGKKQVYDLFFELKAVFITLVTKHLADIKDSAGTAFEQGHFNPYIFWRACNYEQRSQIPDSILQKINDTATILSKTEDKQFTQDSISVPELISSFESQHFVNIYAFNKPDNPSSTDYQKICGILNQADSLTEKLIIADSILNAESTNYFISSIQFPVPGQPLFLYTLTAKEHELINVGKNTREIIVKGLGGPIAGMEYYNHFFFSEQHAKRYAIPAISDYRELAVERIPNRFASPGRICSYWILSPFIREDEEQRASLSREQFITWVTASDTFPRVVEYVMQHSLYKSNITKEQVESAYQNLIGDYYDIMSHETSK